MEDQYLVMIENRVCTRCLLRDMIDADTSMIEKYKAGKLDFTPACPVELLERQLKAMQEYLTCLKTRATIEGIEV